MDIRWFVGESREYMNHLTDTQFYARLPLALCIFIWLQFVDSVKGIFRKVKGVFRNAGRKKSNI